MLRLSHTARAVLMSASVVAAAGAQANLLSNGSFEAGGFVNQGNDTMSPAAGSSVITGWTVVTDTAAWIGASNPFGLSASDGSFFLDLTNYQTGAPFAGMSQTIATTPGATYSLSFDLGSSSQWGLPDSITASAAGTSQTFVSTATGLNQWAHVSMQFVAASATTTVLLQGASGLQYIGLDNADVEFVSGPGGGGGGGGGTGSVPEPGSVSLMLAGLTAIGALRQRRRPVA